MSFLNFLDGVRFTYLSRRGFYIRRERERVHRVKRAQNSAKERREANRVLFCGGLLWNIIVTRIKRLID